MFIRAVPSAKRTSIEFQRKRTEYAWISNGIRWKNKQFVCKCGDWAFWATTVIFAGQSFGLFNWPSVDIWFDIWCLSICHATIRRRQATSKNHFVSFLYLNRIMRIHFHTKFISLFWSALASSALNFHFWNCCHFTKYFRYDSVIVSYAHAHRLVGFNPKCIIYLFFSFSLGPFAGRGLLRMACTNRWWHAHQNSLHGILLERIETKEKTWLRTRRREETERERKKNHTK